MYSRGGTTYGCLEPLADQRSDRGAEVSPRSCFHRFSQPLHRGDLMQACPALSQTTHPYRPSDTADDFALSSSQSATSE